MAHDPTTYLAAALLNDGSVVTYRSLARALKIHSSDAKRMLFDFHNKQTFKKANSVHATYLVSGMQMAKPVGNGVHEEPKDVHMPSSPFMSSSMPNHDVEEQATSRKVITLVREEHLNVVKAKYDMISIIHIYSLEPSSLADLQVLLDVKREIISKCAKEDPLVFGKTYGTISNPHVKRRTGLRPVAAAVQPTMEPKLERTSGGKVTSPKPNAKEPVTTAVSQPQTKIEAKHEPTKQTTKNGTSKPLVMKREHSDIFKSFSKAKSKVAREEMISSLDASRAPVNPQSETASAPIDEPMKDASEDEQEEDVTALSNWGSSQRKSRSKREEELLKMMEDDDETMGDASDKGQDAAPEDQPAGTPISQEEAPMEPHITISGGRRRSRRKVMKKKMLKDEEGYLVTKEELAWESFSEDEPAPSNKPKTPASTAPSTASGKGKRTGAKPGQGNIMSFFGKK